MNKRQEDDVVQDCDPGRLSRSLSKRVAFLE